MIKAIIFDLFGVLVVPGNDVLYQDYPEHTKTIHDLRLQCDRGYMSHTEFSETVAKLINLPVEELVSGYWSKNVRDERAFAWLREVRRNKSYQVALLSNIGRGWLDEFIPEAERQELFDEMVLSNEVGISKPDARIYDIMIDRLGVLPEECVMIDDRLSNVDGAIRVGMQGILFESVEQARAELDELLKVSYA